MLRATILIVPMTALAGCMTPDKVADQQCHHYLDNLDYHAYSACYDVAYAAAAERQQQASQALIQYGAAMQAAQAAAQAGRPTVTTTTCNNVGGTTFCNSTQH